MRGSFLLLILVVLAAVLFPAGPHEHPAGHAAAAACAERDAVAACEQHRVESGTRAAAVSRGRLPAPSTTTVAVVSTPAPASAVAPLIAHVDLRLPGVLRV